MRMLEELNGCFDLDLDLVTDSLDADVDLLLGAGDFAVISASSSSDMAPLLGDQRAREATPPTSSASTRACSTCSW